LFSARWSPDGSRLAVVEIHNEQERDWRLLVMNADGSDEHTLATKTYGVWLSRQPWSPDGSRIAWVMDNGLYTAGASGGDVRRLTSTYAAPSWSPSGSTLVYSRGPLLVIGADGQGERQIGPQGWDPSWSPDGEWITFLEGGGVSVVRPDGSGLRTVAAGANRSPTWSPDGSKIAFGVQQTGRTELIDHAYVVNADGSHLTLLNATGRSYAPAWSPDGDRILFGSKSGLMTVNADGTCKMNLTSGGRYSVPYNNGLVDIASWQPLPNGPRGSARCHSISVTAAVAEETPASAVVDATVVNVGTDPLTKVTVGLTARDSVSLAAASRGCTVRRWKAKCQLRRLEPGHSHRFLIRLEARRVRPTGRIVKLPSIIEVHAAERLLLNSRVLTSVRVAISRCTARDRGEGTIRGTWSADRICGRRGADRIYPGPGNDVVKAGAGNDVIGAADGKRYRDRISCGRGTDRVIADRRDRVDRDCERVSRR
jgi:dipeptidyl aminopeptidase/acylaminoacyl peptidase